MKKLLFTLFILKREKIQITIKGLLKFELVIPQFEDTLLGTNSVKGHCMKATGVEPNLSV